MKKRRRIARRALVFNVVLAASSLPLGANAASASVVKSGSFARASTGFMGCIRAADASNNASLCLAVHSVIGGVHVVAEVFNPTTPALLATSYFEDVVTPTASLSVTTTGGTARVHLDLQLPRAGHVVLDTAPMWTTFNSSARFVQGNCGMTATASADDGGDAVSPPTYDSGTVNSVPVVNADGCSFYWIAPSSGSWAIAAPTDESTGP